MQEKTICPTRAGRAEKELLRTSPPSAKPTGRTRFVLKDVGVFLNSLEHSVTLLRQGGVRVELLQKETAEALTVIVHIRR